MHHLAVYYAGNYLVKITTKVKLSYGGDSRELEEREDVRQVDEPLGCKIDSVCREIADDGTF